MFVELEVDSSEEIMIGHCGPQIGQLRLILIIGILVAVAWLITACTAAQQHEFDERAWCARWNQHTVNDWRYDNEMGCVRQ